MANSNVCRLLFFIQFIVAFVVYCQLVTTNLGTYQGDTLITPNGYRVHAYLSIPYAQTPPIRFRRTQQALPFTGVFNATYYRPACACWGADSKTLDPESSEDCLYVKILSPENPICCLPVMVWYSAGGFNDGDFADYDNGVLGDNFVARGVVLVMVNYRQGPFGFFTTGTNDAPGNYGVWDALEALRFVRSYVRAFGGDPAKVTIMGYEAGAVMAELLTLTPWANGMYSSAIFISSTAFDPVVYKNDLINILRGQRLSIVVGCDGAGECNQWTTGRRGLVVACLRRQNTSTLTSAIGRADMSDTSTEPLYSFFWRPRPDGPNGIFPDSFENLATRRINVPTMMGVMHDDFQSDLALLDFIISNATAVRIAITSAINRVGAARDTCDDMLPSNPNYYGRARYDNLRTQCKDKYVEPIMNGTYVQIDRADPWFWSRQAARIATTLRSIAPMLKSASYMRTSGNRQVYMYSWDYDRAFRGSFWVPLGAFRFLESSLLTGYFYPLTFNLTVNDIAIRNLFSDLLVNFVRYNNPTPPGYMRVVPWQTYIDDYCYLSFNIRSVMRRAFYRDDVLFWLNNGAV